MNTRAARARDEFNAGELCFDHGLGERRTEEADLLGSRGGNGFGNAREEPHHGHLQFGLKFGKVSVAAKVRNEGHVAALLLQNAAAFERGDLAVGKGRAIVRGILTDFRVVFNQFDGAAGFGGGAKDCSLHIRGNNRIDAGGKTDLENSSHDVLHCCGVSRRRDCRRTNRDE